MAQTPPISRINSAKEWTLTVLENISRANGYSIDIKALDRNYELAHEMADDELPRFGLKGTERPLLPSDHQVVGGRAWDYIIVLHILVPTGGVEPDTCGSDTLDRIEAAVEIAINKAENRNPWADTTEIRQCLQATKIEAHNFAVCELRLGLGIEHSEGDPKTA